VIDTIRFVPPPAPTSDPVGALNTLWAFAAGLGFQPDQVVRAFAEHEAFPLGVTIGRLHALLATGAPAEAVQLLGFAAPERGAPTAALTRGPAAEAFAVADQATAQAGLATYTETREALAELLGLVELLATQCADRVDVSLDPRIARARSVGGT
jgi:hypothetical protein